MAEKEVIFRYLICKKGIDTRLMAIKADFISCLNIKLAVFSAD